ncbi:unnamed protein product, partial [Brassica rapa subsp. trilocularis]
MRFFSQRCRFVQRRTGFGHVLFKFLFWKGNKTEIVICSYDDHILVIATQIGAMGTILHARKEEGMSNLRLTYAHYILKPMLVATARRLIDHISSHVPSKPLILSLGLNDHSSVLAHFLGNIDLIMGKVCIKPMILRDSVCPFIVG